ncbi:hydrogenase iron-sulfur subunit [Desulfomonile tiedjei]|uniref:Methyl-viologen-reducing hydrogenase, delta subunit n=1 Tax=Desulfomonile tiedjei (strain ATCC 49306 / DSM 6799 / DCB-1) TaxID=706587 RepID=I4C025_DESTA|nr:hydrogenase iron-sulfur subunit [Desulfomonile tiedjei]AFM22916.1 Methyl-viologen-reducing hydrogenase, delta subunit [Desulfomonile tiedjei DSM 6799]
MNERGTNSVFLTANPPGPREFNRVLVLGGGQEGSRLAHRLGEDQFNVVLIGGVDEKPLPNVSILRDAILERVTGFAGDFHVTLRTPSGRLTERVGAIIAAQPSQIKPKFDLYGIRPDERTLSLSQVEAALANSSLSVTPEGNWFHAAFLVGLKNESELPVFERVFAAIEKLQQNGQVQCYVFTRNLKVAAQGLERRYRETRERGTIFFKFDDAGPCFECSQDSTRILFKEPLLGSDMELTPDLLVVDELYLPPADMEALWAAVPSSPLFRPYLQPDSPRFSAVETPKTGIFAIGAARGVHDPLFVEADIESAVFGVKKLAKIDPTETIPEVAFVDPDKCAICLTCVRLCPHGAIGFSDRAFVDTISCVGCGICAAACPMSAITLGSSAAEQTNTRNNGKIVVFLCSHSGAEAWEASENSLGNSVLPVPVPCAGTVDESRILMAFEQGARGIIVAGCFKGNCASVYGSSLAEQKVAQVKSIISNAGFNPEIVAFLPLAANTPKTLQTAVKDMEVILGGPSL